MSCNGSWRVKKKLDENMADAGNFLDYSIILATKPPTYGVEQQATLARAVGELNKLVDALNAAKPSRPFIFTPLPKFEVASPADPLNLEAVVSIAVYVRALRAAVDSCGAQLDLVKSTSPAVQNSASFVETANALARFRVLAMPPLIRMEKLSKSLSSSYCVDGAGALQECTDFEVFKGQLPIGSGRRSLVIDDQGKPVGDQTVDVAKPFGDTDALFFYALHDGSTDLTFSMATTEKGVEKPMPINAVTLRGIDANLVSVLNVPENPPAKPLLRNHQLCKSMQRINQGDVYPGTNLVSIAVTQKADPTDATAKDVPFASMTVRVNHYYHWAVNTGIVATSIYRHSISAAQTNPSSSNVTTIGGSVTTTDLTPPTLSLHSDPRLMPVLAVTYYWKQHSYGDPFALSCLDRITPNPTIGFRLDSPGSDVIGGLTWEPVRGILLSGGATFGQQTSTNWTVDINGAPITYSVWKAGIYGGVLFDINLFGSQLLALAGF